MTLFILLAIFAIAAIIGVVLGAHHHLITFAFCFAQARFYWSDNQFAESPRFVFMRKLAKAKRVIRDNRMKNQQNTRRCTTTIILQSEQKK